MQRQMPFEIGNKYGKGGKRPGSGRPPKNDVRRVYIKLNPLQIRILYEVTGEKKPQQAIQKYLDMHL